MLENLVWMTAKMLLYTFICFFVCGKGHTAGVTKFGKVKNRNFRSICGLFEHWDQHQAILFYFILPWQWSPLLPHGSVKVLPRWRCRNGRQCVEGWTHSERQSRGGKERTGQRGRGAERSANSTCSQVLAFCRRSLIVVVPTCSSHMKHRRWPQRKRLERNLTRQRKKEKRNKQEDSSPNQLNALRQVTPMQVINHKYRKQMHNNIRRKREVFRTEKKKK